MKHAPALFLAAAMIAVGMDIQATGSAGWSLPAAPSLPAAVQAPEAPEAALVEPGQLVPVLKEARSELRRLSSDLRQLEMNLRFLRMSAESVRRSGRRDAFLGSRLSSARLDLWRAQLDSAALVRRLDAAANAAEPSAEGHPVALELDRLSQEVESSAAFQVEPDARQVRWAVEGADRRAVDPMDRWNAQELERFARDLRWDSRDLARLARELARRTRPPAEPGA